MRAITIASDGSQATKLAVEVVFFIAVRTGIKKRDTDENGKKAGSSDFSIQQLVKNAIGSTKVVDIEEVRGFDRLDFFVLSDEVPTRQEFAITRYHNRGFDAEQFI